MSLVETDLITSQKYCLEHMVKTEIPHGANVPIKLIQNLVAQRSVIAEFGGGIGEKAKSLTDLGYTVQNYDINPDGITHSTALGVHSVVADVTDIKAILENRSPIKPESFDAVISEGLWCNLIGNDLDNCLFATQLSLKRGGFLFAADVLSFKPWISDFEKLFGQTEKIKNLYLIYKKQWEYRYLTNEQAGLPPNHFAVFPTGPEKIFDWTSDPAFLSYLIGEHIHERFARHLLEDELNHSMKQLGMSEIYYPNELAYVVWRSRTGSPLPGFIRIWQKG